MIIVSGGIKGGSGKTTIATNLAIIRANEGKDVLLIDGDDQETATDFTDIRESRRGEAGYTGIILIGNALREQTKKLKDKYVLPPPCTSNCGGPPNPPAPPAGRGGTPPPRQ